MPGANYPTALVREDARRHAAKKRLFGWRTLCGAGRVDVLREYEPFDVNHFRACPDCRKLIVSTH